MKLHHRLKQLGIASALPLAFTLSAVPALAQTRLSPFAQASSVTPENPAKIIEATVWLNLHNKKELDRTAAGLYDPKSPSYHRWLKSADLARFSPTAAEVETLKKHLSSQGLSIVSTGPKNMFVKVRGPVSTMQSAFQTELKSLTLKGEVVRATTTQPALKGDASNIVAAVTGLTQQKVHPDSVRAIDPDTRKPYSPVPLSSPNGILFAGDCFRGVQSVAFQTPNASLPVANYAGKRYGSTITNTTPGTIAPCGYSPAEIATAYGLNSAYKKGLDGTGQTIVIVDAYGSPTITADANAFSQVNGLPALSASNFQIIYPEGEPATGNAGWAAETTLDVEWAHALAPGANIVLLVAPTAYDNDLSTAIFYAIANQLGSVISNSYGLGEAIYLYYDYPQPLIINDTLAELAATLGISVNFSTGDDGDSEASVGVKTVSGQGASPYATAVGGTSLALFSTNAIAFQTGWGTNITKLAGSDGAPLDPPLNEGFIFGSGGGESQFFAKPTWQSALPGVGRQQPDVSLFGDPYTGGEIIFTDGGVQSFEAYGGTSLSCPAFSAIWAIANQRSVAKTGYWLGQAAPIVASLAGTKAIRDVTPYSSPANVAGFIIDSNGSTLYSPDDLAAPLDGTTKYLSTLYNSPSTGSWFDLTFGTDTSLLVTDGWDNVTGYGTPYGLDFIYAAAK